MGQDLEIIPVLNKIDLPNADVDRVSNEIVQLIGCGKDEILKVSAKTGEGVMELLAALVERVPAPKGDENKPLRALIFDSRYDDYRGVVSSIRVIDGAVTKGDNLQFVATAAQSEALEVGAFHPRLVAQKKIATGSVGYIVTGLKNVNECRVGDTVTLQKNAADALEGYHEPSPMVFAGLFCKDTSQTEELREAIAQLKLNDAALTYEPEHSQALGYGFRCGFLGMLHLDIVQERIKREYNLELIVTVPSVVYKITRTSGDITEIRSPLELPNPTQIQKIQEPWVKVDIVTPSEYLGNILQLISNKRGMQNNIEYIDQELAIIHAEMPLSGMIVDFYDQLKSSSKGYASMNYEFADFREAKVERLDVIVSDERIESLASIVYSDEREREGRRVCKALKKNLSREQFEIRIQAAVNYQDNGKNAGGKIVASERISALRKDVTAKLYGGDVTRKRKLLEKQKKGKARMRAGGRVDIPTNAFLAVMRRDSE